MKKTLNIFMLAFMVSSLTGCIKNDDITFNSTQVEIDWASFNARTSGYPFTLFTRVPSEPGRGVYNTTNSYGGIDPLLTRTYTDTVRMRINLVGSPQSTPQTFAVSVNPTFTTAIEGPAATPGVHFQLIDRTVTIPANSNFGFCRWVVRNPGISSNIPVSVIFQLRGNTSIPVSENFQYIGWSISQL